MYCFGLASRLVRRRLNIGCCIHSERCGIKLITCLIYQFVWNPPTMSLANPCRWPPAGWIGVIRWINAVRGANGSPWWCCLWGVCVSARWNTRIIPTVQNLRGGSFSFPPKPFIGVILLREREITMFCKNWVQLCPWTDVGIWAEYQNIEWYFSTKMRTKNQYCTTQTRIPH